MCELLPEHCYQRVQCLREGLYARKQRLSLPRKRRGESSHKEALKEAGGRTHMHCALLQPIASTFGLPWRRNRSGPFADRWHRI